MKILFLFIVIAHGFIHLPGFAKAFGLAQIPQLTQHISKSAGALWLAAAGLFAASALVFHLDRDWWWIVTLTAVVISQAMIISSWHDAKYGTIANALILIVVIAAIGTWRFNAESKRQLASFLAERAPKSRIVTEDMLSGLPPAVRRWLHRSNIVGKEWIHTVYVRQSGSMRTTPDGSWMPVRSEQWFTADPPGFYWIADVTAAPGIHLAGRDEYFRGRGHMFIKALSLVTVADARGMEVDQSTMHRFMAEAAWFPSVALSRYMRWEQIDSLRARATMTYEGVTASGIFTFTPEGDMAGFEAMRYYDRNGSPTLESWLVQNDPGGYREFNGIRIGARSSVTWKLKEGDFNWYRLDVTDVFYNTQVLQPEN